jgi:hypothetical protein
LLLDSWTASTGFSAGCPLIPNNYKFKRDAAHVAPP